AFDVPQEIVGRLGTAVCMGNASLRIRAPKRHRQGGLGRRVSVLTHLPHARRAHSKQDAYPTHWNPRPRLATQADPALLPQPMSPQSLKNNVDSAIHGLHQRGPAKLLKGLKRGAQQALQGRRDGVSMTMTPLEYSRRAL